MSMSGRALPLALCVLAAALLVRAAPLAAQEGKEFRPIVPARPTQNPTKIEVVEFFSYGCPHCARFYPLINEWAARLPTDVVLRRVPVGFNREAWVNLQRAYYALRASGDLAKLDGALFRAIHDENKPLFDEQSLADWVGRNGGNPEKFSAAYTSFGINNQTVQADTLAEQCAVDSIPAMAVDGKYMAQADSSQGEMPYLVQLLANTDRLIARVRAERAAAAPAAPAAAAKRR